MEPGKEASFTDDFRDEVGSIARASLPQMPSVNLLQLASEKPHRVTQAARSKLSIATDWAKNDNDRFGDGHQSLIKVGMPGMPEQAALEEWSNAPELNILCSRFSSREDKLELVAPLILSCIYGDCTAVRQALEASTAEHKKRFVTFRFLALRMSALMFCVAGARWKGTQIDTTLSMDHLSTAKLLIDAGAEVMARDVMGYSCLHHCTTCQASPDSMAIAQLIIKTGRADVNTHMRAGKTPMEEAIMQNKAHVAALLLEAGADPFRSFGLEIGLADVPASMRPQIKAMLARDPTALKPTAAKMAAQSHSGINKMIRQCKARGRLGAGATLEGASVRVIGDEGAAKPLHGMTIEGCGSFDPYSCTYVLTPPSGRAVKVSSHCIIAAPLETGKAAAQSSEVKTLTEKYCGQCSEPAKFSCSACKSATYCSAKCQKQAWRVHKPSCKAAMANLKKGSLS